MTERTFEKAINFYQGKICIRKTDGTLDFVDDSHECALKEEIKIFIEENPKILRIYDIIFAVLKKHFGIQKSFKPEGYSSNVPNEDPLYCEYYKYVQSNSLYAERLKKSRIRQVETNLAEKEAKAKSIYDIYIGKRKKDLMVKKWKKKNL